MNWVKKKQEKKNDLLNTTQWKTKKTKHEQLTYKSLKV